jgi:hypothetical protein
MRWLRELRRRICDYWSGIWWERKLREYERWQETDVPGDADQRVHSRR